MKRSLFLMRRKQTFARILPMTRNLHGVVPDCFTPIYARTSKGEQVTRYPCTKLTRIMTGEIRRCSWVGRKDRCSGHDNHTFTLHPDENPHLRRLITPILNRAKLNSRILTLAADFVTATNLGCRQAGSPAMHIFVTKLIEIGASLPRQFPDAITDVVSLVDKMTDKAVAQAIQRNAGKRRRSPRPKNGYRRRMQSSSRLS
jgi:hypothetical protein